MKTIVQTRMFLALMAFLALGCGASFSQPGIQQSGVQDSPPPNQQAGSADSVAPLITAPDLKKLIDSGSDEIRILEPGRDVEAFQAGHLPTAQFIDWVKDMTDPKKVKYYDNLNTTQFTELMRRLGIKNNQRVIIYDRLDSRLSTRLYWTFKYFGHDCIQILDGGFNSWRMQFPLSTDHPTAHASEYKITETRDEILANMEFVGNHIGEPDTRLIDGRPAAQFSGEKPGKVFHTNQEHPRKGHITGALNLFWKDNFREDGTFKSAEELRALYKNAGVLPDQCVVTYCNEGLHAAPPWFVLTEILNYENVRLYDSSLAEWASSDSPMELKEN